jgi:nucleotide-binding universal stress UspA family protein
MKILLPIDDSKYSEAAIEAVASRAWPKDTVVRVLSAVEPVIAATAGLFSGAAGSLDHVRDELAERAEQLTERTVAWLEARGCVAEAVVRAGDPRSVILDEAKTWPADLIAIGSNGYSGVKRFLLRSVAHSVASKAPCPVEIIRAKYDQRVWPR